MHQQLVAAELAVQHALAVAAQHVVGAQGGGEPQGQPAVEDPVAHHHREDERKALHQEARVVAQTLAFQQGMGHKAHIGLLQVAQAAVDHLRRLGRGARREVALLDQRHLVPAQGGVEGRVGAGDAPSDDEDVEAF